MDPSHDTHRSAEEPPSPAEGGSRSRGTVVVAWIAILFVSLAAVLVALDYATSSPVLCASCHSMSSRARSWSKSTHTEVKCVSCHQTPTAWYQLPQRVADRTQLLARDVRWQLRGRSSGESTRTAGVVSSENCLQCHSPDRKATSGFRILIDHAEHAKRNNDCLSCHVNTAHPEPTRGTPLSLMDRCFTCHGTSAQPKASSDCRVCHPSDYELLPTSHTAPTWKQAGHATLATKDREQCSLCHKASFCNDCHVVKMPHPAGWAAGDPATHAAYGVRNPEVCTKCHTEKPDPCSMCHHKGWEPEKGPWLTQHPLLVSQRGVDLCLRCHTRAYCSFCHVSSVSLSPTSTP